MGRNLVPSLPTNVRWNAVVELLAGNAAVPEVVAATAEAAERQLEAARGDPVYNEAVRLAFLIPVSARSPEFGRSLRDLGLPVGDEPELADILAAAGERLDRVGREAGRSGDFGELAQRALISALSARIGAELPGFFEATPGEVRQAAGRFAFPSGFPGLARSFYVRLLSETLSSFLDRTLATHVGSGRRFAHLGDREVFDCALQQYCFETTRIIHEFSRGWHAKHVLDRGTLPRREFAPFAAFALTKIVSELKVRRTPDA